MGTRGYRLPACCFLLLAASAVGVCAQDYPNKPIRVVVPFPAGGGTDIVARTITQKLGENLGASIVVDNRAGARVE